MIHYPFPFPVLSTKFIVLLAIQTPSLLKDVLTVLNTQYQLGLLLEGALSIQKLVVKNGKHNACWIMYAGCILITCSYKCVSENNSLKDVWYDNRNSGRQF